MLFRSGQLALHIPAVARERSQRGLVALVEKALAGERESDQRQRDRQQETTEREHERDAGPEPEACPSRPHGRSGLELVAQAPNGDDVTRVGRIGFDLGAQPSDVDIDETTIAEVAIAPDSFE